MSDYDYYYKQLELLNELTDKSAEKQLSFFQHILLVSSSTFGILISLHSGNLQYPHIRWVFALSVVLLALGTLSVAIVVYDHSQLVERARQAFRMATEKAMSLGDKVEPVFVKKKRRTVYCEKATAILLPLSLVCLCAYALLSAFS